MAERGGQPMEIDMTTPTTMRWALNRTHDDKFVVAFDGLTKEQAAKLLLAYHEIEKETAR